MAKIHNINEKMYAADYEEFQKIMDKIQESLQGHKLHVISAAICCIAADITVQIGEKTGDTGGDFIFFIKEFTARYIKLMAPEYDGD